MADPSDPAVASARFVGPGVERAHSYRAQQAAAREAAALRSTELPIEQVVIMVDAADVVPGDLGVAGTAVSSHAHGLCFAPCFAFAFRIRCLGPGGLVS